MLVWRSVTIDDFMQVVIHFFAITDLEIFNDITPHKNVKQGLPANIQFFAELGDFYQNPIFYFLRYSLLNNKFFRSQTHYIASKLLLSCRKIFLDPLLEQRFKNEYDVIDYVFDFTK